MKIGLISFHNAANHGAALQAYALEHFLELHGYDCEYIDYQNEKRRNSYDMFYMIKRSMVEKRFIDAVKYMLGAPFLAIRKRSFAEFYRKYLKYSYKTYYTPRELSETNELYDVFISGSDQIWNPHHNGGDISYLLSFVNKDKLTISYSSSFSVNSISKKIESDYVRCLNAIKVLSTREISGVKLIKQLTDRDAKLVLDPVFLLPKEEWVKLVNDKKSNSKFVFSDTNRADQLSKFVKTTGYPLSKIKHHKLSRYTTVSDFLSPKVKVEYTLSPIDYIKKIKDSELVISASFHCTSFAIILNKPFICFLTGDDGKDERLKTLLTHFGLTDRIYREDLSIQQINKPIDWNYVNNELEEKRKDSIDYLLKALKLKV